jgi:hypothetical protein
MQVVDHSAAQYKHLFFRGHRVENGGVSTGLNVDELGVLAIRQRVTTSGIVHNDEGVLTTDLHYDPQTDPPSTPVRIESDLAATKPGLDLLVVRAEPDLPDFGALPPAPAPIGIPYPPGIFGSIEIQRLGVGTETVPAVHYGCFPRAETGRKELAGLPAALAAFDPANHVPPPPHDILPKGYEDRFQNASRNNDFDHLAAGDTLLFAERDNLDNPTGITFSVTIPPAATLTFFTGDSPMEPQPAVRFGVDTVCLDRISSFFYLTWRAVFEWRPELDLAVLEIS